MIKRNYLYLPVLLILFITVSSFVSDKKNYAAISVVDVNSDCTFNNIKLYGKVQVVDAFPDIKVQVVDAFPDINVQEVDAFPDACGKWQFVDAFPDFKIQYVDAFPDVKVKFVDAFPGVN